MPFIEPLTACCICKCAGCLITPFIPQEDKEKLSRPVSYLIHCKRNDKEIEGEIAKFQEEINRVRELVNDAENNGGTIYRKVNEWLEDADKITKEFNNEIKGNHDDEGYCSKCFRGYVCKIGKMLYEVQELTKRAKNFGCISDVSYPPLQFCYRYDTDDNTRLPSRKQILDEIMEALKHSSKNMINIYGLPGAGKTTLLQEIVKGIVDAKGEPVFEVITEVINVYKSHAGNTDKKPDIEGIQQSIARSIKRKLPPKEERPWKDDLSQLLTSRLLNGGRILVVLDDIANACTADIVKICRNVGIPFKEKEGQGHSCTILSASRNLDVRRNRDENSHFRLGRLNLDEAKNLFQGLGALKKLEEVDGINIPETENALLQKCDGLPSAITELAHLVNTTMPSGLEPVLGQLRNRNLNDVDGVDRRSYQSIKRSYELLEFDNNKKFFQLGCLFRSGTSIVIENLMRHGYGLNLLDNVTSLKFATEKANLWVDKLKSLSLFEGKDDSRCIRIHNIVQEFAISTASNGKYGLLLNDVALDWLHPESRPEYTILSITVESASCGVDWKNLYSSKRKALFLKGESSTLNQDFTFKMPNLKVLGLNHMKLKTEASSSIKNLKWLVTLSIENCGIDDASFLSDLSCCLKILSFHGSTVEKFYGEEGCLGGLKLLDLTECRFISPGNIVDVIAKLDLQLEGLYMCGSSVLLDTTTDTRTMEGEVVTQSLASRLASFRKLYALEVEIPRNCVTPHFDLHGELERFKISIGCEVQSLSFNLDLYQRVIFFFKQIHATMLQGYPLRKLLKKTEFLSLVDVDTLVKVVFDLNPCLGNLKCLHLRNCKEIEFIGSTAGVSGDDILPKLETLFLEQLDGLESIWNPKAPQNWCSKLRELKLLHLDNLKLTALPIQRSCKLAVMEIRDCAKLENIFSHSSEISTTGTVYDLPCLEKLELQKLPMLQCLLKQKSNTIKFHSLKTMVLSSLPNMTTFLKLEPHNSGIHVSPTNNDDQGGSSSNTNQMPFFIKEIKFPSLEHLELCDMGHIEKLVDEEEVTGRDAFPKLKFLTIEKIGFNCIPNTIWGKLEQLEVRGGGLEDECLPWTSLPNLRSLVTHGGFLGMGSILSSTDIVQGNCLPRIEYIEIENCERLEAIVSNVDLHDLIGNTSMFLQLKHIILRNLTNIRTFSLGSYEATFQALEEVEIYTCPSLTSFSLGELHTPSLKSVQIDGEKWTGKDINLNTFIKNRNTVPPMEQQGRPDEGVPRPMPAGVETSLNVPVQSQSRRNGEITAEGTHFSPVPVNSADRFSEEEENGHAHQTDPIERNTTQQIQHMNHVESNIADNRTVLFSYGDKWVLERDDLLTFEEGQRLSVNIIDVWAIILNRKEECKPTDHCPRRRLFAMATIGKPGTADPMSTHEAEFTSFAEQLDLLIDKSNYATFDDIDMVLFPILASDHHYYVISFTWETNHIDIIDNSNADDDDNHGKYGKVCENLATLFSQYTKQVKGKWASKKIEKFSTEVIRMEWRDQNNNDDSGIYAMKHMETYMGRQTVNTWDCGFKRGESNQNMISSLRTKYRNAIITSDLNQIQGSRLFEEEYVHPNAIITSDLNQIQGSILFEEEFVHPNTTITSALNLDEID